MNTEETCKEKACSTYDWLCANPLASSVGSTLSSIYGASKNYNGVTSWTLGSVESAVGYASSKAQPLIDGVSGKLEGPSEILWGRRSPFIVCTCSCLHGVIFCDLQVYLCIIIMVHDIPGNSNLFLCYWHWANNVCPVFVSIVIICQCSMNITITCTCKLIACVVSL